MVHTGLIMKHCPLVHMWQTNGKIEQKNSLNINNHSFTASYMANREEVNGPGVSEQISDSQNKQFTGNMLDASYAMWYSEGIAQAHY